MKRLTPDAPAHWTRTRLRHVVRLNPSKTEIEDLEPDQEVSFLPMEAIGEDGSTRLDAIRPLSEVQSGYSYFRDDDVVVAKITPCFENGKGALVRGLHSGIGFGTTELIVARPSRDRLHSEFLQWIFQSPEFRKLGEGFMYGAGGQKRVPDDFVRDYRIALPPLTEQTSITSFLERETGKIDALVGEQRRLIGLLKEKRQAAISHAATNGLDPNSKMKASGVEWLGNVPQHWEVRRLGTIFDEIAEPGDGDLPIFSVSIHHGVSDKELDDDDLDRKVSRSEDRSKYKRVQPLDLVYNMMRAWQGGFGSVQATGMVSPAYVVARPKDTLSTPYVEALLRTPKAVEEMRRRSRGITDFRLRLYWDEFKDMSVALPPLAEQREITRVVATAHARAEALIAESAGLVDLLQERRAALISAAVTGKIDVGNAASQQEYAA